MILVLTDTHCYYDIINKQIEYAENVMGISVSSVIHLGDFGIYKSPLHDFFIKKGGRFCRPLYFIDGNHEDFSAFEKLVDKYGDFFTYLPRSSIKTIEGYRFLSLGGTSYMDSYETQRGAIITDKQINDCLSVPAGTVDIILTHDCPAGIGVPNTPGLEYYGETGFKRSAELVEHFKPKLWLFGHHHKWFEYKDAHTYYYGLSGAWKGFGFLDSNYNFSIIRNFIEWEKNSLLDKIKNKFLFTNPRNNFLL